MSNSFLKTKNEPIRILNPFEPFVSPIVKKKLEPIENKIKDLHNEEIIEIKMIRLKGFLGYSIKTVCGEYKYLITRKNGKLYYEAATLNLKKEEECLTM